MICVVFLEVWRYRRKAGIKERARLRREAAAKMNGEAEEAEKGGVSSDPSRPTLSHKSSSGNLVGSPEADPIAHEMDVFPSTKDDPFGENLGPFLQEDAKENGEDGTLATTSMENI